MEARELQRGRLIDHIQLVVADFDASYAFYKSILNVLRIPVIATDEGYFWADELVVSTAVSAAAQGHCTGRTHVAFQAANQSIVDAFYVAALSHGGKDNSPPGVRPYHPNYYACFVLDPDGNNIEAVFHGNAARSAASVKILF